MKAAPKVVIKIRVRLAEGFRYVNPVVAGNGKLKALYAIVNGQPEHHPEGLYYLRFTLNGQKQYEPVGKDPTAVLLKQRSKAAALMAVASGVALAEPEAAKMASTDRVELAPTIDTYLESMKKRRKTFLAYALALRQLKEAFGLTEDSKKKPLVKYADEVGRDEMMKFVSYLEEPSKKLSPQSVANRVRDVKVFWRNQGWEWPLLPTDKIKTTERLVNAYSQRDLNRLFSRANEKEYAVFQFFLCTGCREQEVAHAIWPQLEDDNRLYKVMDRDEYNFKVKDSEERQIPVPDSLLRLMASWRKSCKGSRLIFPNGQGNPEGHFLRILKKLALRAGLNCGTCTAKNGKTCDKHPVCGKWELHRFRRTFATMHHKNGASVQDIQRWLGHEDIETTMRYLAGSSDTDEDTRQHVNKTFSQFAA